MRRGRASTGGAGSHTPTGEIKLTHGRAVRINARATSSLGGPASEPMDACDVRCKFEVGPALARKITLMFLRLILRACYE
jgi:hypothetical protein